jgi:hypothetical protein
MTPDPLALRITIALGVVLALLWVAYRAGRWFAGWENRRDLAAMRASDRRVRALRAANTPRPPRRRVIPVQSAQRALAQRRVSTFLD